MWPRYHMFIRKQGWNLVIEWTLGLMNGLKYHWYETSLSQAVLKHVMSKGFIFKKSTQGAGSACFQEWRNQWHCSISKNFMSCYITFKKTCGSQVGRMWVTSRSFCGSVGQMGHQVWPTFNPAWYLLMHVKFSIQLKNYCIIKISYSA